MLNVYRFTHASRSPKLVQGIMGLFLVLALLITGPAAVQAQGNDNRVPLTLEYHEDVEEEGTLPAGTEVLVYHEAGTRATPLSAWGSRSEIQPTLAEEAKNNFGAVFDELGENGETDLLRIATEPRQIVYVLARISEDGNARFYESQVGGSDVESGPGLDLVVSGNMDMDLVSEQDTAWAKSTFERVIETSLDLQDNGQLSEEVEVRVWKKDGRDFEPLDDRESIIEKDHTPSSVSDGTTEEQFERTAYNNKVVYVLARATDDEGERVLYESVWEGEAGFGPVTGEPITMNVIEDDKARAMMASVFQEESGWGWVWWGLTALIGVPFIVLLLLAGRALSKKEKKKNRRRQKGKMERFWKAVIPSSRETLEPAVETPAQISEEGKGRESSGLQSQEIVASNQQKGAQKTEIIDDLRDEVKELKEEVRKRDAKIRKLHDQLNGVPASSKEHAQSSNTSRSKSRRPSTADKIGKAFKKWCTKGSPAMVDRYQLFGRQVESEISSASFRRIMRENNAAGLVFDDNAQDPVEYWLVEARGTAYLLPQPTRNGFRELGECFDGKNVSPSQINTVRPAELKKRGSGFVLEKKGRIE